MSKSGRATGPPLARRLRWLAEAGPAWLIYGLMRALPLDWASALVGRVFRLLGPRLALSEKARASLRRAFPEKPEPEIESILREVWDNLGRTVGELAHLDRLIAQGDDARIEVVGRELLERYKRDDPACLTFCRALGQLGAVRSGRGPTCSADALCLPPDQQPLCEQTGPALPATPASDLHRQGSARAAGRHPGHAGRQVRRHAGRSKAQQWRAVGVLWPDGHDLAAAGNLQAEGTIAICCQSRLSAWPGHTSG